MMDGDEGKARQQNRTTYIALMGIFPLLFFILYWSASIAGESIPFSLNAFFQPYFGDNGFISLVLGFVGFLDIVFLNLWMIPRSLANPQTHLIALTTTEVFAIFGFIIGFLNFNPWAALPYLFVSFANYVWVYNRIIQSYNPI